MQTTSVFNRVGFFAKQFAYLSALVEVNQEQQSPTVTIPSSMSLSGREIKVSLYHAHLYGPDQWRWGHE